MAATEPEWMTRLRWIAEHPEPTTMPEWMGGLGTKNWAGPISEVAKLAVQKIDGLSEKVAIDTPATGEEDRSALKRRVAELDDEVRALIDALDENLLPYPRWRHKVRGSIYAEIARATVSTNGPDEGKRVVVYRSTNYPHEVFARDEKEFEDGRFERL